MSTRDPIPQLFLERLAAQDLPEAKRAQVLAMLEDSPEDRARLAQIEDSNRQILEDYPVRQMAAAIEERARRTQEKRKTRRSWISIAVPSITAAAAALLLVVVFAPTNPEPYTGIKGGSTPRLVIHKLEAGGHVPLSEGDLVRAGDSVQLEYVNSEGRAKHGVIFSVDGRGTVTLHFPNAPGDSTRIERSVHLFDFAYELDDAPAFERFFFVSSPDAIDVQQVLDAASRLKSLPDDPLDLPPRMRQYDVTLLKAGR